MEPEAWHQANHDPQQNLQRRNKARIDTCQSMKLHRDIEQNSVEWQLLRAGKVTASELHHLISPLGKIREGEGVTTYLNHKLVELWTGGADVVLQGIFDVEQGRILEEKAKPAFTIHTGLEIESVAFIETDDGRTGCSPDGMICGIPCGVEIKCPRIDTHIGYLLNDQVPKQYIPQIQGSMFFAECDSWHFFSYHRKLPPLHIIVYRDDEFQDALSDAIHSFIKRLDEALAKLIALNGGHPPRPKPIAGPEPIEDILV
jgi:YqaJ-like recombinase protein